MQHCLFLQHPRQRQTPAKVCYDVLSNQIEAVCAASPHNSYFCDSDFVSVPPIGGFSTAINNSEIHDADTLAARRDVISYGSYETVYISRGKRGMLKKSGLEPQRKSKKMKPANCARSGFEMCTQEERELFELLDCDEEDDCTYDCLI